MSDQKKTHREVKKPQISARFLADYMAASETAKRTIVRNCKYQPIARVIQHDEAKAIISKFIWQEEGDTATLHAKAKTIKDRMADSVFDRDLFDHNADYITRFANVWPLINLPEAQYFFGGKGQHLTLNGVRVTTETHFRLRRITKTNKIKVGVGALRYQKGKALSPDVAEWQSAYLLGYLGRIGVEEGAAPEHKLCVTLDAYSGAVTVAPSDAVRRFQNMEAACASIAERWPAIEPPPKAVL
ncbi:MAG: hypothetical protein WBG82_14770 [Parvibaculum sp.]|uniref:hypothetical protein n=1 Tax=Parvibaculum sp. TaxID=2024848 RepID=UPI003C752389